jgi:hypothetical protein
MFVFITIIISYLVTLSIIYGTKIQTKTRKSTNAYWKFIDWKESDKRPKWMIGVLLVNYILCLIPIINLIWSVLFLMWYFEQLKGPNYDSGGNLIAERIVYSNKFTKWLTKEV